MLYYIESDDIIIVKHLNKKDIYIQANFSAKESNCKRSKDDGYAEGQITLFNVSDEEETRKVLNLDMNLHDKKKIYHPEKQYEPHFNLS